MTSAHASDWVSVDWAPARSVAEIDPSFIVDAGDKLPASATVSYWNGTSWTPVSNQHTTLASSSGSPSRITFDPVTTTKLKLEMTSAAPNDPVTGNVAIAELKISGVT